MKDRDCGLLAKTLERSRISTFRSDKKRVFLFLNHALSAPVQLSPIHDALLSSQLTTRLFSIEVVYDVQGVTTGRDEFRAFFGQLGEHFLPVLVDEGHAG